MESHRNGVAPLSIVLAVNESGQQVQEAYSQDLEAKERRELGQ